jgi:hypothetical protein
MSGLVIASVMLSRANPVRGQTVPALVDRDLSVGAGATLANAAGQAVALFEGRYVPDSLFDERGVARRGGNIAYRALRVLFFDLPQEQWLLVANHEVFGHGGRVRELLDGFVGYGVDPPAPYGRGGGVTFYQIDRDVTVHELQAISVAGMEANGVAAGQIARRVFIDGRMSPRTALRYLGFELDAFDYIQKTGDQPERAGHDVSDFLQLYNLTAEFVGADRITPRMIRRRSWLALANPVVASALVSIGRYVATGSPDGPVFAIPVGRLQVMPALRYRLTPYGTEWELAGDVRTGAGAAQIAVRVGEAPLARPWAVAARYSGLSLRDWQLDLGVDLWRQPPLALGARDDFGIDVIGTGLTWGGEARATAESAIATLWWSSTPATLIVDAGLKSQGFVPGEPLGPGLVLRAGLGLPLGRR